MTPAALADSRHRNATDRPGRAKYAVVSVSIHAE